MAKKRLNRAIKSVSAKYRKRFVIAALRKASIYWKIRNIVIRNNRVERGKYRCEACGYIGSRREFEVDHIKPVIDPKKGFEDFNTYILRLFPLHISDYQLLCKKCHKIKTKGENRLR